MMDITKAKTCCTTSQLTIMISFLIFRQLLPVVFLNKDIQETKLNTSTYLVYSIYLVEVSYMFQPYIVIIGLATRDKISTQLHLELRPQCFINVLYQIYTY
jgi:hypothetical protein